MGPELFWAVNQRELQYAVKNNVKWLFDCSMMQW